MTEYVVATLAELTNVASKVVPGDTVRIRGAVYQPTSQIIFRTSGTSSSPITYEAYAKEKVVFDGSLASWSDEFTPLLRVDGSWNILRNIEERYAPGCGILVSGADCALDHVEAHHNRGYGLNTIGDRCKFLYCIAHDNIDPQATPPGSDGDGMGASSPSSGNYFLGCLAYGNSDDGIDVWGANDTLIEKCVAHSNGLLQGDGNGFKLGIGTGNRAKKCVAYNNRASGFILDGATLGVADHCTAWANGDVLQPDKPVGMFVGFQNWGNNEATYSNNIGTFNKHEVATPTQISNSWNLGITDPGFISIDSASPDFLSLRADSPCRGKASDGTDIGALQYGEKISDLLGVTPTPTPTPPIIPIIVGAGLGYAVGREPGAAVGALAGAALGSVSFKYRERLTRIGMLGRG
jgi:parallel beta-helix repeat protein